MGCVVVFCTVYALILPALTMEGTAYCGQEEHVHTDACYTAGETSYKKEQICSVTGVAHTHTDICYDSQGALVCTLEEVETHTHTGTCYEEVPVETASEETTGQDNENENVSDETEASAAETVTERKLICDQPELSEHVHSEACFETVETVGARVLACQETEHTHTKACYANPKADVETEAVWEKTFEDVTLTGDYAVDVLAIAASQLGYTESSANYIMEGETQQGYTRYGAWYGVPYGEWCAMYVSFCLNYAEVEGMPLEAGCQNWINKLQSEEYDLYVDLADEENTDYIPQPGDLIFFNLDSEPDSDHVGIVTEYIAETEENAAVVKTIEGNSYYKVRCDEYEADDASIMGYGKLPEQIFYCGNVGHVHTEECYDSVGKLCCEVVEHIHTEKCNEPEELSPEEQEAVDAVISAIEALPTMEEFSAKLQEFEDAEDMEGYEAYWSEVQAKWNETYQIYQALDDNLRIRVVNREKFLEYDGLWDTETLDSAIVSDKPTVATSASTSEFIDLNLYDYGSNINDKWKSNKELYPGFQWNGGAYSGGSYNRHKIDYIDFGNSMITDFEFGSRDNGGKSVNAQMVTAGGQGINAIDNNEEYGVTNRPIGMSIGKDVLKRTLVNGYPALSDGTSLEYLFKNGTYAKKQNTASIDGLFQQDEESGAYKFNSRENHAQYSNNKFVLYDQIITPNYISYPFGNFLPFNTITEQSKATQVSKIQYAVSDTSGTKGYVQNILNRLREKTRNSSEEQLYQMLAKYRDSLGEYNATSSKRYTWSAADAMNDYFHGDGDNPSDQITFTMNDALLQKMYNIDWDVETNFFFGMDMSMNFIQPKDGMTGNDTDQNGIPDYPMEFFFSGDDDVWVYVDDVLFLDLSGIHRHVGGRIDFKEGKIYYYYLDTKNKGDVSEEPYKIYTFAEMLKAAGKSTDGLNEKGAFKDYTMHSFKFFYMERGSGSSVCRMNFNFPLLRQNSISVSKQVASENEALGNPDYKFQVLKADADEKKTEELFIPAGYTYTIYDENGVRIGTGTTGADGVFTLKAGQKAEFTGIKENAGKYYVRELLDESTVGQYGNVTVSGESTTTSNGIEIGEEKFTGKDSPIKDISEGATSFYFTNNVESSSLASLIIEKQLIEYSISRSEKMFDIQVELDGQLLPVGTEYVVGENTKKVETEGIVRIAAGETATISSILAGTRFKVQETTASAEGYVVAYIGMDSTVTIQDGVATGMLVTNAEVQLIVKNSEKGTKLTIPGEKSVLNPDGSEHNYEIQLKEVTDATGTILKEKGLNYTAIAKIEEGEEKGTFSFDIDYVAVDEGTLPHKHYYKITETKAADSLPNATVYVVETTVFMEEDNLAANITNMWKDGKLLESASDLIVFENTLAGELILRKTLIGTDNKEFEFEIQLTSNETKDYAAIKTKVDGTPEALMVSFVSGKANVYLNAGESLQIVDIAYGTQWTIRELNAEGYEVSYEIQQGEMSNNGKGMEVTGIIIVGNTSVVYTNSQQYKLPESGGIGTTLFMIGGLTLMSAAGILLYNKSHRREGKAS